MDCSHGDTYSELTVQHLEFRSIIGEKWINPASILRIITESSVAANPIYERLGAAAGLKELPTVFMKWRQMQFLPSYYDKKLISGDKVNNLEVLNRKLKIRRQILPPGRTSQQFDSLVIDQAAQEPLIFDSVVVVVVDPSTHKPTAVHPSYKEYFTPEKCISDMVVKNRMPPSCKKVYEIPKDVITFTFSCVVAVHQIDENNHMNQAEYCNLCINCVGEAFFKSIFGNFGSIYDNHLQRISFLYLGECRLGETVDTICWQGTRKPLTIKFHVMTRGRLSCQAEFEFFAKKTWKSQL